MTMFYKTLPLNGGANLNFNVVGSTTLPTKPKENTIWVNTDVKIPKWSLDGREPVSPINGQVWIQTLNSSGSVIFNALKKNEIDTQLSAVYQWNDDKWTKQEAYIYQDGEWQQFSFLNSNIFAVTARATKNTTKPTISNVVTNTDNYTTVVIDNVIPTGGNYGESRARLYIDGVVVLDTGKQSTTAKYKEAASTWSGSFPISKNGTVYADIYTTRDSNIDDNTDPISITVNFHFEGKMGSVMLTNLIGDELEFSQVAIDSAWAIRDAIVYKPVQANHRYFVLWEGGNWGGAYTSVGEYMTLYIPGENYQQLFYDNGLKQRSYIIESPVDGTLAITASSHCATEAGTSSGIYCYAYMLVDLTEIELARGKQFASAEEFWNFIGSSAFYGTKEFDII